VLQPVDEITTDVLQKGAIHPRLTLTEEAAARFKATDPRNLVVPEMFFETLYGDKKNMHLVDLAQ
jgi:hypothetical protein